MIVVRFIIFKNSKKKVKKQKLTYFIKEDIIDYKQRKVLDFRDHIQ